MKKYIYFFLLFLYVIGTIAGIGNCIYIGEYVTAVGVAVLAFMAWPTAVNYWIHAFKVGSRVNIEFDIIGKYISRINQY